MSYCARADSLPDLVSQLEHWFFPDESVLNLHCLVPAEVVRFIKSVGGVEDGCHVRSPPPASGRRDDNIYSRETMAVEADELIRVAVI